MLFGAAASKPEDVKAQNPPTPTPIHIWGHAKYPDNSPIPSGSTLIFKRANSVPIDTTTTVDSLGLYSVVLDSLSNGDTIKTVWNNAGTSWNAYHSDSTGLSLTYIVTDSTYKNPTELRVYNGVLGVEDNASTKKLDFSVFPNPYRLNSSGDICLKFDLPEKCQINVGVYDVSGRLVKSIYESETLGPGTVYAKWDGRDANGIKPSSGIYFMKATEGKNTNTKRVVMIK